MPTETATHIRLDDRGVAWIDQTNVKVIEVVLDKLAHGSSPEEMHFQYPHLSLSQIYAAWIPKSSEARGSTSDSSHKPAKHRFTNVSRI